jgi:hypothetical protein
LQALALQNDVQMLEAARVLAENTITETKDAQDWVTTVFQRILVRNPKAEEQKVLEEYYGDALDKFLNDRDNAEKLLAQGEYERQDTDPAKTAALMLTAQVIYNLDETITRE